MCIPRANLSFISQSFSFLSASTTCPLKSAVCLLPQSGKSKWSSQMNKPSGWLQFQRVHVNYSDEVLRRKTGAHITIADVYYSSMPKDMEQEACSLAATAMEVRDTVSSLSHGVISTTSRVRKLVDCSTIIFYFMELLREKIELLYHMDRVKDHTG